MRTVARILLYVMNAGLILLGIAGLLAPAWDLEQQLRISSLGQLTPADYTALLVHWRYLKGFVIGVGIYGFWKREQILRPGPENTFYLMTLALAATGRVLGLIFDGRPPALVAFALAPYEIIAPILIYLGTRRAPAPRAGV
ncbi:MAG TPA: DUF4345 family protein [Gemmatimonadaceae bacterium]|nr:DUF4345 family protein [Gemmatimonadaceae bacterium]